MDTEDDDDIGGPPEKKGKLDSVVKVETVIKEEPVETSHFDEQSVNSANDSIEQNSEVESRSVKVEDVKSKLFILYFHRNLGLFFLLIFWY